MYEPPPWLRSATLVGVVAVLAGLAAESSAMASIARAAAPPGLSHLDLETVNT